MTSTLPATVAPAPATDAGLDVEHAAAATPPAVIARLGLYEYCVFALLALVIAVPVSLASAWWLTPRAPVFAVLDVAGVIEAKQLQVTSAMMDPGLKPADRDQALQEAQAFGPRLEAAIDALQHRCGCTLLTRNAFVSKPDLDYTDELLATLGMQGIDIRALRERISAGVQQGFKGQLTLPGGR